MQEDIKNVQLQFNDAGEVVEEPEVLDIEPVAYEDLDKVDLVRLCKEKDEHIKSYQTEREAQQTNLNNELSNMNDYYTKRISELKALISYYERKFEMIKAFINIEKGDKQDDTIQRTTKR